MEQIHLGVISKFMKDRKVIGSSQYRYAISKSHLTSLISFYDKVTGVMHKGRAMDFLCIDFIRAFGTVPHALFIKLASGEWISEK